MQESRRLIIFFPDNENWDFNEIEKNIYTIGIKPVLGCLVMYESMMILPVGLKQFFESKREEKSIGISY